MSNYLDFEKSIKQIDEDIANARIRGDEHAIEILNKKLSKEITKVYKKFKRIPAFTAGSSPRQTVLYRLHKVIFS